MRIYQGGRVCRGDAQVDPPAQDHSRRDDAQASGEIAGFSGPPQRRGKTGRGPFRQFAGWLEPGANLHFTVSPLSERFLTGAISVLGGLSEASFSFLIKKSSARLRCRRFRVVRKLRLSDGPGVSSRCRPAVCVGSFFRGSGAGSAFSRGKSVGGLIGTRIIPIFVRTYCVEFKRKLT